MTNDSEQNNLQRKKIKYWLKKFISKFNFISLYCLFYNQKTANFMGMYTMVGPNESLLKSSFYSFSEYV